MDNKERWYAAVALFGSLEKRDAFFATVHGIAGIRVWTVQRVSWRKGQKWLECKIDTDYGVCHMDFTIETFIDCNCTKTPSPEPEKSEAEELWDSLGKDSVFWAPLDNEDGVVMQWRVTARMVDGSGVIDAGDIDTVCSICRQKTHQMSRSWFIANATATRPKTEREVELEEQVKELESEKSQTEQAFTDYVEGAAEDCSAERRERDLLSHRIQNQGKELASFQKRYLSAESRVKELEAAVVQARERVANLHVQLGNEERWRRTDKSRVKELEEEVEGFVVEVCRLQRKIICPTEQSKDYAKCRDRLQRMSAKLENATRANEVWEQRVNELEKRSELLKEIVDEYLNTATHVYMASRSSAAKVRSFMEVADANQDVC